MAPNDRLDELFGRLRIALLPRGKKADLARALSVTPQQLNDWITRRFVPNGETTLALLDWVQAEEAKQPTKKSPGRVRARPEPKTRSPKSKHEKKQSNPP